MDIRDKFNQDNRNKKALLIEHMGGQCKLCGYKKCNGALIFHHLVENTKSFRIACSMGKNIEAIKEELKKCVMLCQNCHIEVHLGVARIKGSAVRFGRPRKIVDYAKHVKERTKKWRIATGRSS